MTPKTQTEVDYAHQATDQPNGDMITFCGQIYPRGRYVKQEQFELLGITEIEQCPQCALMQQLDAATWAEESNEWQQT